MQGKNWLHVYEIVSKIDYAWILQSKNAYVSFCVIIIIFLLIYRRGRETTNKFIFTMVINYEGSIEH